MIIFKYDKKSKRYDGIAQQHGEGTTLSVPWFENGFVTVFNETTKNWQLITEKEYYENMKPLGVDDEAMTIFKEISKKVSDTQLQIESLAEKIDELSSQLDFKISELHRYLSSKMDYQLVRINDLKEKNDKDQYAQREYLDRMFEDHAVRANNWSSRGIANMVVSLYEHNRKPWYKRIFSKVRCLD